MTRAALLRATEGAGPPKQSLSIRFSGCCGLAQCIAGYALQDAKKHVRPLATQSLTGWFQGHAALSTSLNINPVKDSYLVDPTFIQFANDPALRDSPDLLQTLSPLLTDGYCRIQPVFASKYLSYFCKGQEIDASTAYRFMVDPPPHPYHFRRDIDCDDYSRANLGAQGLLLPTLL